MSYERQRGNGNGKSWSLRFFLLAINLLLFFLLLQISFLQTTGLILLGVSVVILLIKYFRRRVSNNNTESKDSVADLLPLVKKYIRINKRYVLASILGLSLAILVFSQILLLANGGSSNTYFQTLSSGQTPVLSHKFSKLLLRLPKMLI